MKVQMPWSSRNVFSRAAASSRKWAVEANIFACFAGRGRKDGMKWLIGCFG